MRTGTFLERDDHAHVPLRRAMLDSSAILPMPLGVVPAPGAPRPSDVADAVAKGLREQGAGLVQLDEPLSDADFVEFGAALGTATEETDPAVQPFVTDKVILNLVNRHERTADVALQPFAENSLSLHSEGSGRPLHEQPRYIVLMCCSPGADPTSAQTVLIPMADVLDRLTPRQREVLSRTRYAHLPAGQTILREHGAGWAFSFRDFLGDALNWVNDADDEPGEVDEAIRALLAAMYQPGALGVHWSRGLLVVIDNARFFHGRTAGVTSPLRPRHLKRLRIR